MIRGNVHSHEKGLKGELRDRKRNMSSSSGRYCCAGIYKDVQTNLPDYEVYSQQAERFFGLILAII